MKQAFAVAFCSRAVAEASAIAFSATTALRRAERASVIARRALAEAFFGEDSIQSISNCLFGNYRLRKTEHAIAIARRAFAVAFFAKCNGRALPSNLQERKNVSPLFTSERMCGNLEITCLQ
ncbi:hypothetical protein [Gordoniibacillus kamchatkensis]|uniref:hypothetical protein n=1 Tax=Gordoniibacillus kamchatkensis TaxID=1590651 RepID=UPI0012E04E84|nr:hypothetical protein [Paenibacillus sp. VKM B-2647]